MDMDILKSFVERSLSSYIIFTKQIISNLCQNEVGQY